LERETLQAKWLQNPLHEIEASSKPRHLKMGYMKKRIEPGAGEHKVKSAGFRIFIAKLQTHAGHCVTVLCDFRRTKNPPADGIVMSWALSLWRRRRITSRL